MKLLYVRFGEIPANGKSNRDKCGSIAVYGKADGDYFVFCSHETDEEVCRVKCPVIRESEGV